MGFFGKKGKQGNGSFEDNSAITSILDQEMLVVGDVTFKGKTRLDGRVEGNVQGDYLIVSESGSVNGDIDAQVVICHGQVDGNIRAEKIQAMHAAIINGSLVAEDLAVESGAKLSGEIKALSQELHLVERGDMAVGGS